MTKDGLHMGIFSWFGFVMPLEQRLKLIKDAGFNSVSIWWEDEEGDWPVKKEDIPRLVKENGLEFENIHAPFSSCNGFWSGDKNLRDSIVKKHIGYIEECSKFHIPLMVMHVTEDFGLKETNSYGIESIKEIVEAGEKNGVKVAIENTDDNFSIHYLLSNIKSPNLGLCFDSSHNTIAMNREINLLKLHGDRLFATHISDSDGLKDRHWLPYDGNIEWKEIKKYFPVDNYNGYLSMEVFVKAEDKHTTPEKFLNIAYERISKLNKYLVD